MIAPPERSELVDVSAEKTLVDVTVESIVPLEEQAVVCRVPLSNPLTSDSQKPKVPTQVDEQTGPPGTSQDHRNRSHDRGEHSSRKNSTVSVTSRSGWTYG